jgi:hypothetical protein
MDRPCQPRLPRRRGCFHQVLRPTVWALQYRLILRGTDRRATRLTHQPGNFHHQSSHSKFDLRISFFLREWLVNKLPAGPPSQVFQTFAVVPMLRVVEVLLECSTGEVWTEPAVLKAFVKRTAGNFTDTPEQLAPGCLATGAIGFGPPFTNAAVCAAHANKLNVHHSASLSRSRQRIANKLKTLAAISP